MIVRTSHEKLGYTSAPGGGARSIDPWSHGKLPNHLLEGLGRGRGEAWLCRALRVAARQRATAGKLAPGAHAAIPSNESREVPKVVHAPTARGDDAQDKYL